VQFGETSDAPQQLRRAPVPKGTLVRSPSTRILLANSMNTCMSTDRLALEHDESLRQSSRFVARGHLPAGRLCVRPRAARLEYEEQHRKGAAVDVYRLATDNPKLPAAVRMGFAGRSGALDGQPETPS
jgi:hypothetical protein